MDMIGKRAIKINASDESLPQAQVFVGEILGKRRISAGVASETAMVFEALFREIVSQVGDSNTELEIGSADKLASTDIKITYPGKRFSLPEGASPSDPDAKTIETFSDKISCSYQAGCNVIRIPARQSAWVFILPNLIGVVAALIVGVILESILDDAQLQLIAKEWVVPLEKLFTNAVLMVGAPMTLFSLLKNVTDVFMVAERHSSSRRLLITSMASSLFIVVLAGFMGFVVAQSILSATGITERVDMGFGTWSLASAVDQIIPSSIITPFETISPIPMIVVALLIAGSLSSIGQSFNIVKRAVDACYDLFSGILAIVMAAFPVACFLLFLEILLTKGGVEEFLNILCIIIVGFVCVLPLLVVYAFSLKAHGIPVREFARKLWPLLKENLAIGSVIDAIPYNTRYCEKHFGIPRERLEKELPVLAQTSLDGNCFILMLLAAIYVFVANCEVTWINVAVIGFIVMFLSFGAPNQPGSILIGMLVILTYLNAESAISLALCFELFYGPLQNILNVISSVVTVAENECRERNASA